MTMSVVQGRKWRCSVAQARAKRRPGKPERSSSSVPSGKRARSRSFLLFCRDQNVHVMSGQAEHAFVKSFVNILASQPVTFDDDFQEQPEKTLKKVPVLHVSMISTPTKRSSPLTVQKKKRNIQVDVPAPPELKREGAQPSGGFYPISKYSPLARGAT